MSPNQMIIHKTSPFSLVGSVLVALLCISLTNTSLAQAPQSSLSSGTTSFEPAAELVKRIQNINQLFRQWRYDEAFTLATELYAQEPDIPSVIYLAGRAKFYMQDYDGAIELISLALSSAQLHEDSYLDYAKAAKESTKGFLSEKSENFEIRVAPGPDEILIPYALEALEKAYQAIGSDFNYFPSRRIIVEAFTRPEDLSSASGLPVEAIRTTGTVAICKHNKIMFTTPRALLMGYTWLDTLSHEYVHYVVSRVSHNTVPIWLHEGIAKFQETRWAGEAGLALNPYGERLLTEALRGERGFITFEEMHPSMALLPSQEHTSLAFAQVFTVVEYMVQELGGYSTLSQIMSHMQEGKNDAEAISSTLGVSFSQFQRNWQRWLQSRPMRNDKYAVLEARTYSDGPSGPKRAANAEQELQSSVELKDTAADKHSRLGDLLRMRNRHLAASKQYEKAYSIVGPVSPRLPNRLAITHIQLGNIERAEELLVEAREPNPNYVPTHVRLGEVYLAAEKWNQARDSFYQAKRINPFDPSIHTGLLAIYRKNSNQEGIDRASRALSLLRQEAYSPRR